MELKLTIDCGNAAFDFDSGGPAREVARILKKLAKQIEEDSINLPDSPITLYDVNGNKVGACAVNDWRSCTEDEDAEEEEEEEEEDDEG